jgi:hypothetical protein
MKHKLFSILFVTIIFSSFGENPTNKVILGKQPLNLSDSLAMVNQKMQDMKGQNFILEDQIKQATSTISNQNSLITGFGAFYECVSIFIMIIGIGVPLSVYLFSIRPSRAALNELKINFENNFEHKTQDFLDKKRKEEIEQAIKDLTGTSPENIINALNFLTLTRHEGYTDEQLFKLFTILNEKNVRSDIENSLPSLLAYRKNVYATEYLKKAILDNVKVSNKYTAMRYFLLFGFPEYLELLKKSMETTQNKFIEFSLLINMVSNTNKTIIDNFLNEHALIDLVDTNSLHLLKTNISGLENTVQYSHDKFIQTYVGKKLSEAT